jgi:hypothetical protein
VVRAASISGKQPGKHVPAATDTNAAIEERCFVCAACREFITMAAGALSELSSAREAVEKEPERLKLKNLHC